MDGKSSDEEPPPGLYDCSPIQVIPILSSEKINHSYSGSDPGVSCAMIRVPFLSAGKMTLSLCVHVGGGM